MRHALVLLLAAVVIGCAGSGGMGRIVHPDPDGPPITVTPTRDTTGLMTSSAEADTTVTTTVPMTSRSVLDDEDISTTTSTETRSRLRKHADEDEEDEAEEDDQTPRARRTRRAVRDDPTPPTPDPVPTSVQPAIAESPSDQETGVFSFPPKAKMRQGTPQIIEVYLGDKDIARLIPKRTSAALPLAQRAVTITPVMDVRLIGDKQKFDIVPMNPGAQGVKTGYKRQAAAKWAWAVTPLDDGNHQLELQIYAGEQNAPTLVLQETQIIDVEVDYVYIAKRTIAKYWPHAAGVVVVLTGIRKLWPRRRKRLSSTLVETDEERKKRRTGWMWPGGRR